MWILVLWFWNINLKIQDWLVDNFDVFKTRPMVYHCAQSPISKLTHWLTQLTPEGHDQKNLWLQYLKYCSERLHNRFHIHSSNTDWVIGWKSEINPLINPVNTRGTCSHTILSYKIWDSVQRGYILNFIFIATILTELLAEKVKITY